jgi:hypothetical protein
MWGAALEVTPLKYDTIKSKGVESFSLRPLYLLEDSHWIQDCVGFRMRTDVVGVGTVPVPCESL